MASFSQGQSRFWVFTRDLQEGLNRGAALTVDGKILPILTADC